MFLFTCSEIEAVAVRDTVEDHPDGGTSTVDELPASG
jgi:hypothetical protein